MAYRYEKYDDPYRVLAASVVVEYEPEMVGVMIANKDVVRTLIIDSLVENIDCQGGMFADCAMDIMQGEHQIIWGKEARKLAEVCANNFNIERFQNELRAFAKELDVLF